MLDHWWDVGLFFLGVVEQDLGLWVAGDWWSLADGDWLVLTADKESSVTDKGVNSSKCKNKTSIAQAVPGVSLDDGLAGCFGVNCAIVDGREDESIEDVHQEDVSNEPPDEDLSSGSSVALSEDLLSLGVVNDDVEATGGVCGSVSPADIVKVAHGVDGDDYVPPEVAEVVGWKTGGVASNVLYGIDWFEEEWAQEDNPTDKELGNVNIKRSSGIPKSKASDHAPCTIEAANSVDLEEAQDNSEVWHGVLDLSSNGGNDG